jgi:hypothetical protein
MVNKDNSERIERYLREQMSPEENETFLNDLKNDKDLREEAQMIALLIKEMKEEQAKQDSEITEEILATKKPKPKTISIVRWVLSIAALFIIIFDATLLWSKKSNSDALFSEYYSSYAMQGKSRGGDSDIEKELAMLFNKVGTNKDVAPVIEQLQTIYDSIDTEYEYSLYADDITWYLALAYLKADKPEKTKELLKTLIEKDDIKAKELYDKIK